MEAIAVVGSPQSSGLPCTLRPDPCTPSRTAWLTPSATVSGERLYLYFFPRDIWESIKPQRKVVFSFVECLKLLNPWTWAVAVCGKRMVYGSSVLSAFRSHVQPLRDPEGSRLSKHTHPLLLAKQKPLKPMKNEVRLNFGCYLQNDVFLFSDRSLAEGARCLHPGRPRPLPCNL